jgi:glutamine cyclotransferase
MRIVAKWGVAALAGLCLVACRKAPVVPKVLGYEVVSSTPHDSAAYTQGLQWTDGKLYETTGRVGESSVRLVDRQTGEVLRKRSLPAEVFGEGMVRHGNEIWILTWQDKTAFVLDAENFRTLRTYNYEGEGWGLTTDGKELIMSDGSDRLVFRSFKDFSVTRTVKVTKEGRPVRLLNELEYVKGEVFANIYTTNMVVKIDPKGGEVTGAVDFSGLRNQLPVPNRAEAFNGIAYDKDKDRFLVTGKWWPRMFEIRLKE